MPTLVIKDTVWSNSCTLTMWSNSCTWIQHRYTSTVQRLQGGWGSWVCVWFGGCLQTAAIWTHAYHWRKSMLKCWYRHTVCHPARTWTNGMLRTCRCTVGRSDLLIYVHKPAAIQKTPSDPTTCLWDGICWQVLMSIWASVNGYDSVKC